MKRLLQLVLLIILTVVAVEAQIEFWTSQLNITVTAPVTTDGIQLIGSGTLFHQAVWNVDGSVTSCSFKVDSSPDGITWGNGDILGATTCTTNGSSAIISANVNWIRIRVTTFIGSGNTVVSYFGYAINPSGGGSFYQTIQDEGSDLPQQVKLNFTGTGVTCSNGAGVTNCAITSGGGSPAAPDTSIQFNDGGVFGGDANFIYNKTAPQIFAYAKMFAGNDYNIPGGGDTQIYVSPSVQGANASITGLEVAPTTSDFTSKASIIGIVTRTDIDVNAPDNVNYSAALRVSSNAKTGTGTISNNYGIDIQGQQGIGINNYGIHIQDQGTGANDYAILVSGGRTRLDGELNFSGSPGVTGQVLISNGPNVPPAFGDPIVSGPAAIGTAPVNNPIWFAGSDYSVGCGGGQCIRALKVDSSGQITISNSSFTVSGTVTSNQGGAPWTVKPDGTVWALTGTSANVAVTNTPSVTLSSGTLTSITNKVGITGADGDIFVRQTTASNLHTAATLDAETTKVIGTVRTADGVGNLLTTNSTTYTAKFALDANLLGTLGTAFSTAGKVDVKGADGDVFVRQTTGTNLHAVIDSGSTTAVTQATASNLNATVVGTGTFAVQAALNAETTKVIGTVRNLGNAGAIFDGATGAAPPANVVYIGGLTSGATGGFLTGIPICDSYVAINVSTATTTLHVTGVSGRHVRICSINLVTAAANNVALISGTGATCGTGTAGIAGGTSAASGWNFAANGGLTIGSGIGTTLKTIAAGDSVCSVTSASTQLSGSISYTIY